MHAMQIGNAILEFAAEQSALYEYLWQHAFLSDTAHTLIGQRCKNAEDNSPLCSGTKDAAYNQLGNIDAYNIYATTCHDKKVKPRGSNCMVCTCTDRISSYLLALAFVDRFVLLASSG
jgi:serine carboxypeptidase-like clade II